MYKLNLNRIVVNRLAIAFFLTFLVADLCPHPSLSPGVITTTASYIRSFND